MVANPQEFCAQRQLDEAIWAAEVSEHKGIPLSRNEAYTLLQSCTKKKNISCGRRVQSLLIRNGLICISVLTDHLIRLFASCDNVIEANQAFDKVIKPSVYTWSAILSAHSNLGHGERSLDFYRMLQLSGMICNTCVYIPVLKACVKIISVEEGRLIHDHIVKSKIELDNAIGNLLIHMYAQSGRLEEAHRLFDKLKTKDVVSWSALIAGYAHCGDAFYSLELFKVMQEQGITADKVTFLGLLKACANLATIGQGMTARGECRLLHGQIITGGLSCDAALGNTIIDTYSKCGCLEEARGVFEKLENRNVVSWDVMIAAYALHGYGLPALELFFKMKMDSITPDKVTFLSTLKACATLGAIEESRHIHSQVINSELKFNNVIANTMIDVYAKCGSTCEARMVFDKLQPRDSISWGAMIAGYAQNGDGLSALELFDKIQYEYIAPDEGILLNILKSCGSTAAIGQGRYIHYQIMKSRRNLDAVIGSSLIDMYARCESLEEARGVFEKLQDHNVVSWGVMISAYAQNSYGLIALDLFRRMEQEGIEPDILTFLSILKACGSIGAIDQGRIIHDQIVQYGFESDAMIGGSLVDMYAKCGSTEEASETFQRLQHKNIIAWGAMVAAYAQSGNVKLAADCLKGMQQSGIKLDDVIFSRLLAACSHAFDVDEGNQLFKSIKENHGMAPNHYHYACMIDILGRAGCLNEAEDLLQSIEPSIIAWTSLLRACKTYSNVEIGRRCFDQIIQLDPYCTASFVLMSDIYANANMWEDVTKIEKMKIGMIDACIGIG